MRIFNLSLYRTLIMPVKQYLSKKLLLVPALIFFCNTVFAQDYQTINYRIDSLVNIGLPKSALAEVNKLDELARQNKNAPMQIKAVLYRMTFQSYIEENSLVAIIDTLKSDINRSAFPVRPVLQSVLASMYYNYYQQNRWQFSQRTRLEKPGTDYTKWDLQTIIDETSRLYSLSLQDERELQSAPISILDGALTGDKSTRYLRPTLYDLLVQRALDFFLSDEPALTKPKQPFSLNDPRFFSDNKTFAYLLVKTADTSSTWYKGIIYLQKAARFHLQKGDEEPLADLDIKRLGFLHNRVTLRNKDSLYLNALQQIENTFIDKPISADAMVLQGQYYQQKDSLKTARLHFDQAVKKFPGSIGAKNADIAIEQIEQKLLTANMEATYSPGKPILMNINYRNVKTARIFIYKLSAAQATELTDNQLYSYRRKPDSVLKFLAKLKVFQQQELKLPDPMDYRIHSAEFKIDTLQIGIYGIVVRDISSDTTLMQYGSFKVSHLSYASRLNPDNHVQLNVMDRETGRPLRGVRISMSGTYLVNRYNIEKVFEKGTTDADGSFITKKIGRGDFSVELSLKNDSIADPQKYTYGQTTMVYGNQIPDKTILFTDRQIYRPGQTIYFKILALKILNGNNGINPDAEGELNMQDANGKTISTVKYRVNEFGTYGGSFILPLNMLNGNVILNAGSGRITVSVEEYKRPTFLVEFLPVKESYKPGDSVMIKGTVTSFSGYGLSRARVAYHIVCTQSFPGYINGKYIYRAPVTTEIATDTLTTDDQGNYTVKFKAIPGENMDPYFNTYTYNLNADVTDASGETHTAQAKVTVGRPNMQINARVPDRIVTKDPIKLAVSINNLNMQPLAGDIRVQVYPLQQIDRFLKKRFWKKPDQQILTADDYKKYFPEYADREDNNQARPALNQVEELNLKVTADKPAIMQFTVLPKQPSGIYKIKISATNLAGDTTSITKFVDLVTEPSIPQNTDDWVMPVIVNVKPGENARFVVGADKDSYVLMEKYCGAEIMSSKWLSITKGQQYVDVPVAETDSNVTVQFLMVHQNRIYVSAEKITVDRPDNTSLKLGFLTFRDKLQPGEKEQWKLRITGSNNEKENAELLATLYDASLDNLTEAQSWRDPLYLKRKYVPNYFTWDINGFLGSKSTIQIVSKAIRYNTVIRNYERLNMFNYGYYGGYNYAYNNYIQKSLQKLNARALAAHTDSLLEETYKKVVEQVKNGIEITGQVKDEAGLVIPGVIVKIKSAPRLAVTTNSTGYFRIKVPVNEQLVFSFVGYETQEVVVAKSKKLAVSLKASSMALSEVLVVGYGTQQRTSLAYSLDTVNYRSADYRSDIDIRGFSGMQIGRTPGIRVNGKEYAGGDVAQAMQSLPADIMESVQVIDDYGNQASAPITTRKNFAETAFFYPQLHTDKNGEILIDFTIPESLTKWRFKGFAHTKDLKTGYIEQEIVTQKQLSINANMPRFLREGDTITVSARLANLTAAELKGKVNLQLFNALNMQPVSLLLNPADARQSFTIGGATTKAVSFRMVIPAGLDALDYRLTAEAGKFTDGEENTLPVLPNRMLVTESMPMMVRPGKEQLFTFNKLVNRTSTTLQNKSLTLEYTQNPVWYAVQALPYMMEFPYECSEQVFSRYYANSLATNLVNKMSVIKKVFDQWKSINSTELLSNLEKNQELKTTLIEETPWLRDAENETEQKKRIALLFDINKMSYELQQNLDKLQKKQLPNGGFPWFGGDYADRYITQHILAGMGQLYQSGVVDTKNAELKDIADKAMSYLDNTLIDDAAREKGQKRYDDRVLSSMEIHAYYAQSYFTSRDMGASMQALLANYLKLATDQWTFKNVYEQAMIALTMQRNKKPKVAQKIIRSLLETAQQSDDMGMYWAKNQLGYYWYQSPVETQSLMIELFTEIGNNDKAVEEMKIWLLGNKQTSNWKTTKATAAACYALLMKGDDWLDANSTSTIKLDGKALPELKPDIKTDAGTGYIKTTWTDNQVKPELGKVDIKNDGKTIAWGALYWQYLETLDKITPSTTDIQLERKYFIQKQTDAGPVLTAVDATHQPKTGDLLKVVVYLKAGRDFEYIHLKDMRPAGTEPIDVLSAYKYQDGLYYYQVTKDVATNFFISTLNKGNYVFEYRLRVAQPGNFSTGISTVESMYAPEFNAHSEGSRLMVKPN